MKTGLHPLKAALELSVRFAQSRFGIDREIARDIDQHKKQVADFIFKPRLQLLQERRFARSRRRRGPADEARAPEILSAPREVRSVSSLEFVEQAFDVRPVEADLRGARAQLRGFEQSRHGRRNSGQNRLLAGPLSACASSFRINSLPLFPLLNLYRFPVAFDLGGSVRLDVAEDVRMAMDEFGRKAIEHVVDGK